MPPEDIGNSETETGEDKGKTQEHPDNVTEPGEAPEPKPETVPDNYWKRKHEAAEKELAKIKRAQMSEAERVKADKEAAEKRAESAEKELTEIKRRSQFDREAAKHGINDADYAYFLLNEKLNVDDSGKFLNLESHFKELRKSKPAIFSNGGVIGTGGITPPNGSARKSNPAHDPINAALRSRRSGF